jgi:DNA mismatch repair protein Mlh1 C-terminus
MVELLSKMAPAMRRNFGIVIDADGTLAALPELLSGHRPDTDRLPELMVALAADVDWADEAASCRGVAEVRAAVTCRFV